jgi:hypothetical protein
MAQINLPNPQIGRTDKETLQNLLNAYHMMRKQMEHMMQHLDSDNVTEINTNLTRVRSNKGTTVINGPVLEMRDRQEVPVLRLKAGLDESTGKFVYFLRDALGNLTFNVTDSGQLQLLGKPIIELYDEANVLRLRMGFDMDTGKFVYEMFNAAGEKNIGIDGEGNGIITGGTVKTAETGARVELSGNSLKTYNAQNQLNGLVTNNSTGTNYGDVFFYDSGVKVLEFYNNLTGGGFTLQPVGSAALGLGSPGKIVVAKGDWDCFGAGFADLKDENGNAYATQAWVAANFSPIGHTHI